MLTSSVEQPLDDMALYAEARDAPEVLVPLLEDLELDVVGVGDDGKFKASSPCSSSLLQVSFPMSLPAQMPFFMLFGATRWGHI